MFKVELEGGLLIGNQQCQVLIEGSKNPYRNIFFTGPDPPDPSLGIVTHFFIAKSCLHKAESVSPDFRFMGGSA